MLDFLLAGLLGAFYGYTMKIADLLDEHGLKWFKGADLLFGILWGLFGCLLVLLDIALANILLAMALAFIIRRRLDYPNHCLAASMVIVCFLIASTFNLWVFASFYLIFLLFGSLKDYIDDVMKKKGLCYVLSEAMLYYPIPALVFSWLSNNWIPFIALTVYTLVYDLTKLFYKKKGFH